MTPSRRDRPTRESSRHVFLNLEDNPNQLASDMSSAIISSTSAHTASLRSTPASSSKGSAMWKQARTWFDL
eukprot:9348938-Pyramimonas_sp.AAC.1